MYVVWQSRERKNWNITRHSARLVESVRVAGKPRQTFVAFLGSYETWLGNTLRERHLRNMRPVSASSSGAPSAPSSRPAASMAKSAPASRTPWRSASRRRRRQRATGTGKKAGPRS